MDGMHKIYLARSPSGRVYVGMTGGTLRRRIGHHMSAARRGSPYVFHAALRKYGDEMVWEVLEEVEGREKAWERERTWVALLGACEPGRGYNGTLGGDGGGIPTEETRERLSKALRGRELSEEHKRRIGEALTGRRVTWKEKIAASKRGGTHGGGAKTAEALRKRVRRSDGVIFGSVEAAARDVGRHPSNISRSIAGGTLCAGYLFVFADVLPLEED